MPADPVAHKDDWLTLIAISVVACVLQNIVHEGLGHGVMAWLSGSHRETISTVALQSDISSAWISANGTLANLHFAAIFWLLLLRARSCKPATRYFLVIALAGNLFTATGYFFFSGVTDFGDWAAVIGGMHPHWAWRVGLVLVGMASYYASVLLVADKLKPFKRVDQDFTMARPKVRSNRLRELCWTPYFTDGILAGIGGALNPLGWFYVIASALPSTLGANAGLISLPCTIRGSSGSEEQVGFIGRSITWIVAGAAVGLFFIVVLGRGVTWSH